MQRKFKKIDWSRMAKLLQQPLLLLAGLLKRYGDSISIRVTENQALRITLPGAFLFFARNLIANGLI
jgi:hypothetical protein